MTKHIEEKKCICACHDNLLKHPYGHSSQCCEQMNGYVDPHELVYPYITTLSIKIHEEAIKELEGRKKEYPVDAQPTDKANEMRINWANPIAQEVIDEAITYHQKEISKLKT